MLLLSYFSGEIGPLYLVKYADLTPTEPVIVATIVGDFMGYLHPKTAKIEPSDATLSLDGYRLSPIGVRAEDVQIAFIGGAGGCTPTGAVTTLNNHRVVLRMTGLGCTAPGPLYAYLTVARKPAQKLPLRLETGNDNVKP